MIVLVEAFFKKYIDYELLEINDENIQLIEDEIMLMYDKKPCDYPDYECLLSLRKYMINRNVLKHQEEILPDIIAFNDALREALKEICSN